MIEKSHRLAGVNYDIRGPVFEKALEMERQGNQITRLNIGNPGPYGYNVPDELASDIINEFRSAQGYSETKGILAARRAIVSYYKTKNIFNICDQDVYIGNGVSELILLCLNALLNPNDQVLIPSPDYPLWTASTVLAGGRPVHYHCDEASGWLPDLGDIASKITDKTKALVVINPNNPTGAVYPKEIVAGLAYLADKHGLVLFSDEIYDQILFENQWHYSPASYMQDSLCVVMSGLSKNYCAAGFRAGWLVLCGNKTKAQGFIEGLHLLASMRLCSNVLAQLGIQAALGNTQFAKNLTLPNGRLRRQRDLVCGYLDQMPGISYIKPQGAFYVFPKIDLKLLKTASDLEFVLDLLDQERVLLVHGGGFNHLGADHFRLVFLPPVQELETALLRMQNFVEKRAESVRIELI